MAESSVENLESEDCDSVGNRVRFFRLATIILDCGTKILQHFLRQCIEDKHSSSFYDLLNDDGNNPLKDFLQQKKGKLNATEIAKLSSPDVHASTLDISLVIKLLRQSTISGLKSPKNGWDKLPERVEISKSTYLVIISVYRNHLFHQPSTFEINKSTFNEAWKAITYALITLENNELKTQYKTGINKGKFAEILKMDIGKEKQDEIKRIISIFTSETEDLKGLIVEGNKQNEERHAEIMNKLGKHIKNSNAASTIESPTHKVLMSNYEILTEKLPLEDVLSKLLSKHLISLEEKQGVKQEKQNHGEIRGSKRLICKLLEGSEESLNHFIEILGEIPQAKYLKKLILQQRDGAMAEDPDDCTKSDEQEINENIKEEEMENTTQDEMIPAVLFVADYWAFSKPLDNLAALNKMLSRMFAKKIDTINICSSCSKDNLSKEDEEDALACKVTLLDIDNLSNRNVTHIVGYAPRTYKKAFDIKSKFYPEAELIIINYEIPCLKSDFHEEDSTEAEIIEKDIREAAKNAKAVFSLGQKVFDHFREHFEVDANLHEKHKLLWPYCGIERDIERGRISKKSKVELLSFGPVEEEKDLAWRGLDIVSQAIGKIVMASFELDLQVPRWTVRGSNAAKIKSKLRSCESFSADIKSQTTLTDCQADLKRATLCLLSSPKDSFEMIGIEAIHSGIPLLVASESGLAKMIEKIGVGKDFIVPTNVETEEDKKRAVQEWKKRINTIMKDPNKAKSQTQNIWNGLSSNTDMFTSQKEFMSACGIDGIDLHVRPEGIIKLSNLQEQLESFQKRQLNPDDMVIDHNPKELARLEVDIGKKQLPLLEMTLEFFMNYINKMQNAKTAEEKEEFIKLTLLVQNLQSDGKKLIDVKLGSIVFTIYCPTIESLELFWQQYTSGQIRTLMESLLITDQILKKYHARGIQMKTTISESDYESYKEKLQVQPKVSYENLVKKADHCFERGEDRKALFLYQKAIILQRTQGRLFYDEDYNKLSAVCLQCSKIWLKLESFEEATSMVDQSLDLKPSISAYKHRAHVMEYFAHTTEALRNYLEVLQYYREDANEDLFEEVIYKICKMTYNPRDYAWLHRLQQIEISSSIWENVIYRLAREEEWYYLYTVLKNHPFSQELQLQLDYSPLLRRKENWVPKLLLSLLKMGANIKYLKKEGDNSAKFLFEVLQLSGKYLDLFEYIVQNSTQDKSMQGKHGTLLHMVCCKTQCDWHVVKRVLDLKISPWIPRNEDYKLGHELMQNSSEEYRLLVAFLQTKYTGQISVTDLAHTPYPNEPQVTVHEIKELLKCSQEQDRNIMMALVKIIQFALKYGDDERLSKMCCSYIKVMGSILAVLDISFDGEASRFHLPQSCSEQVAHHLSEENQLESLFKLLQLKIISDVTLNQVNLSKYVQEVTKNIPETKVLDIIKEFSCYGADLNSTHNGKTLLKASIEGNMIGVAVFLVRKNICLDYDSAKVPLPHTAVDVAIKTGNFLLLEAILMQDPEQAKQVDEKGNTVLHHCATYPWTLQSDYAMKVVCSFPMNPSERNISGFTARKLLSRRDDNRIVYLVEAKENYKLRYPSHRKRSPRQRLKFILEHEFLPVKQFTPKEEQHIHEEKVKQVPILEGLNASKKKYLIMQLENTVRSLPEFCQEESDNTEIKEELPERSLPDDINIQDVENLQYELQMNSSFMQHLKEIMRNPKLLKEFLKRIKNICTSPNQENTKPLVDREKVYSSPISDTLQIIWMKSIGLSERFTESASCLKFADLIQCLAITEKDQMSGMVLQIKNAIDAGKRYRFRKQLKAELRSDVPECGESPTIYHLAEKHETTGIFSDSLGEFEKNRFSIQKFYPLIPEYIHQLLIDMDGNVDVPFAESEKEYRIIHQETDKAILLLGRSGTGKTTCCLRRLWMNFKNYWFSSANMRMRFNPFKERKRCYKKSVSNEAQEESDVLIEVIDDDNKYDHLQQIFLTKNAILVSEAEKMFQNYCHTFNYITQPRIDHEHMELPRMIQHIPSERYPLFLTSRQFMLLLDASLPGEAFFFDENGQKKYEIPGWTLENHLTILTDFDQDRDIDDDDVIAPQVNALMIPREVTPDMFESQIWPKMKQRGNLTVHPSLIWTEFMSFIKGSQEAMRTDNGYLSLDEYKLIGKKQAIFSDEQRELVYFIFKEYQKILKTENMFDEMDIIFKLHKRDKDTLLKDWCLHELYVDETQDFSQAELCLVLGLCQNPNNVFLTGDTAQTIMKGISFRFQDLTTMFHGLNIELQPVGKNIPIRKPKVQYLVENYRSHDGILNLAAGVVSIMKYYFPESFDDNLPRDIGSLTGPKPVILENVTAEDLAILLRGHASKDSQVELGANQAILVVNDKAREELPEILHAGIVLTIYEAKGLEFDDILLYNFFKDSCSDAKDWDVIRGDLSKLAALNDDIPDTGVVEISIEESAAKVRPASSFDEQKHKILNSDLKYLYTAITRARKRIWIYDECEEKQKPMYGFFKHKALVEKLTIEKEQDLPMDLFASETSAKQWDDQGNFFIQKKLYKTAKLCYEKAKLPKKVSGALAYMKINHINNSSQSPRIKKEEYLKAAELFVAGEMFVQAARCLYNGEEYETAAALFKKIGSYVYAAQIYSKKLQTKKSHWEQEAADCYILAGQYREAIDAFVRVNAYDKAVEVVLKYEEKKSDSFSPEMETHAPRESQSVERLSYQAADAHFHNKSYDDMMSALDKVADYEAKKAFLESRNLIDKALDLMKAEENFEEAARLSRRYNKLQDALSYCQMCHSKEMKKFELECILSILRVDAYKDQKVTDIKLVKKAKSITEELKQTECKAEVMLLEGMLFQRLDIINSARKFYLNECSGFLIGSIHCSENLMKISNNKMNLPNCRVLSKTIEFSLETANALHSRSNNFAQEITRKCLEFYGISLSENKQMARIHVKENPRLHQILTNLKQNKEMIQVDKYGNVLVNSLVIYKELVRDLLRKIGMWCAMAGEFLSEFIEKSTKCLDYAAGYECTDKSCRKLKEPFTLLSHQDLYFSVLTAINLENAVNKAFAFPFFSDFRMDIHSLLDKKMFEACELLWTVMFPLPYHDWASTFSKPDAYKLVNQLRAEEAVIHINNFADNLWMKATQQMRQSDTSLFIKLRWLYQLANKSPAKIEAHLKSVEDAYRRRNQGNQYKEKIPRHVGLLYTEGGSYSSIMRMLLESTASLYIHGNPVGALTSFVRFLSITVKRGKSPLMPEIECIMPYVETMSMLAMVFILRFDKPNRERSKQVFLPSSYISLLNFFDLIFLSPDMKLRAFDAVHYYEVWFLKDMKMRHREKKAYIIDKVIPIVKDKLVQMIEMLLGGLNEHYNLLQVISQANAKYITNGTSERFVVFLLVLLINSHSCDLPGRLELVIRKELRKSCFNGNLSSRFAKLLVDVELVEVENKGENLGICGIAEILCKYLRARDYESLNACTWRYDVHSGPRCIKGLSYSQMRPGEIQKYQNLPKFFRTLLPVETKTIKANNSLMQRQMSEIKPKDIPEDDTFEDLDTQDRIQDEELERKDTAALIITRLFRKALLKKKMELFGLNRTRPQLQPNDLQLEFTLDNTMCNICSVSFVIRKDEDAHEATKPDEEDEIELVPQFDSAISDYLSTDGEDDIELVPQLDSEISDYQSHEIFEEKILSKRRSDHVHSTEHIVKVKDFKEFCGYNQTNVTPTLEKVDNLIEKLSRSSPASSIGSEKHMYQYDLQKLRSCKQVLLNELNVLKSTLDWNNTKKVISATKDLRKLCTKVQLISVQEKEKPAGGMESWIADQNDMLPPELPIN